MNMPDYEKAAELLIDKVDKLRERIKELEAKLQEEYNRGVKDGLNQVIKL